MLRSIFLVKIVLKRQLVPSGLIAFTLVLAVGFIGCNQKTAPAVAAPAAKSKTLAPLETPPETVEVTGMTHLETVELQGASVVGLETTGLVAKVGGYVSEIGKVEDQMVDIGSQVKKNDLLARLSVPEMESELLEKVAKLQEAKGKVLQSRAAIAEADAAVLSRKAEVEQVRAHLAEKDAQVQLYDTKSKRIGRLVKSGAVSSDNLDEVTFGLSAAKAARKRIEAEIITASAHQTASEAMVEKAKSDLQLTEAGVRVAEADIQKTKTMMAYREIRAPYDGVITKRSVDHGAFVRPASNNSSAEALFEITRVDVIRIIASVPGVQARRVAVGQKVLFHSISGHPGTSVEGTVSRVAMNLEAKTRTLHLEVQLNNPVTPVGSDKPVTLSSGLFGSLSVIINEWGSDNPMPSLPASAVGTDESGQAYVMVLEGDQPQKMPVKVVFNNAVKVGLGSGVTIGQKVLKTVKD